MTVFLITLFSLIFLASLFFEQGGVLELPLIYSKSTPPTSVKVQKMATFPFKVNNVDCPTPSEFSWSRQQVSAADSGRTQDGLMHVNRVTMKDKIQLSWNAPDPAKAATILQMFDSEYFDVTYRSPLTNTVVTKTFYRGDATANTYWWAHNGLFEKISFNIIER